LPVSQSKAGRAGSIPTCAWLTLGWTHLLLTSKTNSLTVSDGSSLSPFTHGNLISGELEGKCLVQTQEGPLITLASQLLGSTSLDPPSPSAGEPELLGCVRPWPSHQWEQTFCAPPSITQTPIPELTTALSVCCQCRDTKRSCAKVVSPSATQNARAHEMQTSVYDICKEGNE